MLFIGVPQRNGTNGVFRETNRPQRETHRERERETYVLRNWLTQWWRMASLESARWSSRWKTQGAFSAMQRQSASTIPSCSGKVSFCLLMPSPGWTRPTPIIETICFTQSLLIKMLISFENIFGEASRKVFDLVSGHHSQVAS